MQASTLKNKEDRSKDHDNTLIPGNTYRVKINFNCNTALFTEGESLIFKECLYSRYDGLYVYSFLDKNNVYKNWILPEDTPSTIWHTFFEEEAK